MTDKTISQVRADNPASALTGAEILPCVQSAASAALLVSQILTYIKANFPLSFVVACSDQITPVTAGTGKVTFPVPYGFTVTGVIASLAVVQGSGSIFTVDINKNGISILSTKLTIDNNEYDSTTASTPPVISTSSLSAADKISIDVDQVGNGTAIGLVVVLLGHAT